MSRVHVPALLTAVFVLVAVPAALAARAPSPTPHSPAPGAVAAAHHAHRRPERSVFVRARRAALVESRRARAYAHLLRVRVRSSREIWHARSVHYLVWLRHVWARRAAGYLRVLRVRLRGVHAARAAMREVGVPYVWGMSSPGRGFDCSGLVLWAYSTVGIHLPRTTWGMMGVGRRVSRAAIRPGDLVFSYGGGHVGIYEGHGIVVHAPHAGTVVSRSRLSSWSITEIRRVHGA